MRRRQGICRAGIYRVFLPCPGTMHPRTWDLMRRSTLFRATLAFGCAALLAASTLLPQSPAPSLGGDTQKAKPDPRKARSAFQEGLRAERQGDWAAAFDAYN